MRVAFIGWRGMVGSVLMERMLQEDDFKGLEPTYFSTSNAGGSAPSHLPGDPVLGDAFNVEQLATFPIIVSCQGSGWTQRMHPLLRGSGWKGIFIDASSALRMAPDATLVLDPLNKGAMQEALRAGRNDLIGANCTVSLMLMAFAGLIEKGWVSFITSMTYQAASGAGAKNLIELADQMHDLGRARAALGPAASGLHVASALTERMRSDDFPDAHFEAPLAGSVIPWIDRLMDDGSTREEWKGHVEANKILGLHPEVPVDGLCVRIGAFRCHSQAVTIGLKQDVPLDEIQAVIAATTPWTQLVGNERASTLSLLTPTAVTGSLDIPVGRLRKSRAGHLLGFTVGDQLLWGAAEPIRRALFLTVHGDV